MSEKDIPNEDHVQKDIHLFCEPLGRTKGADSNLIRSLRWPVVQLCDHWSYATIGAMSR
ncbi:hypothetical protein SAMN04515695_5492 [Pseudovibrio sp. Tun.PSC04-5.I4]|nr:hypothetical protein SAMN04515695_5492 [Pseudovibrio sp. Tun.PSC04-5.I4]